MDRMNYIPDAIRPFQIELLPVRRAAYGLPAIGSGILGNSPSAVISCKWGGHDERVNKRQPGMEELQLEPSERRTSGQNAAQTQILRRTPLPA